MFVALFLAELAVVDKLIILYNKIISSKIINMYQDLSFWHVSLFQFDLEIAVELSHDIIYYYEVSATGHNYFPLLDRLLKL